MIFHQRLFGISISIVLILISTTMTAFAAYPERSYPATPTVVDGDYGEWDLSADFFHDMYEAGKSDKEILSKAYLRYDCQAGTLYILVLAVNDQTVMADKPADNWLKVYDLGQNTLVDGNSGTNGVPPDFAWINRNGNLADGWEASVSLAEGTYAEIEIHAQIVGDRTSSTGKKASPVSLEITCPRLSLGDTVWHDVDSDGIQDGTEPGIGTVPLWLFKGTCNTGQNYNTLTPTATTTTDNNGKYLFTNLVPGSYCVVIPEAAFEVGGVLAGRDPTNPEQGGDPALDSNGHLQLTYEYVWASATLTNSDDLTIDFGFLSGTPTAVSLSSLRARSSSGLQAFAVLGILGMIVLASTWQMKRRRRA
ncbi:MAG: hypothetical protein Kow0047_09710 [Anaerolineae bacterium]